MNLCYFIEQMSNSFLHGFFFFFFYIPSVRDIIPTLKRYLDYNKVLKNNGKIFSKNIEFYVKGYDIT